MNTKNQSKTELVSDVGKTGFEPATSRTPCARATGLRYIPSFHLFSVEAKYRLAPLFLIFFSSSIALDRVDTSIL